ncbi:hypothetical protein B9G55_18915 [Saccharibacillus sp. O16]|nr:hypothetical protein B9G55_18915 [Saccharibacillus sp. O16]
MSERKDMTQDMAEAYALGGLEEMEIAEFEAYLQDNIDEQLRVAALRDTVGLLASTAAPVSPPTGMKSRILANVLNGSESISGNSKGTDQIIGGLSAKQPADSASNANAAGIPAQRQAQTKGNEAEMTAAQSSEGRVGDADTDLLLEQAQQNIEAGEARRAAEARAESAQPTGSSAGMSEVRGSSAAAAASENDGAGTYAARTEAGETSIENVRTVREAARARGGRRLWAGAAAVMAAAAILLGVYSAQLRGELNNMHRDMTAMQQQTTALAQHASDMEQRAADMEKQLDSFSEPVVGAKVDRTVALAGSQDDPKAWGTASMVSDDTGVHLLVQAADLPELSGNEAYQLWLIKDGTPINGGTFKSDSGSGALAYTMKPDDYDMVVITLEPDAQGDKPRGRPVLTGVLNG